MKLFFRFVAVSVVLQWAMFSHGQITITQSDLPEVDDTYILTYAVGFQTDLELTGAGFFWDFSGLTPLFSVGDTFKAISDLSGAFQFFFLFSDMANRGPAAAFLENLGLEGAYTVYTLTSSKLQIDGYAAELLGIPIPMVYGSKDVVYHLPLHYGKQDSSQAFLEFSLPGVFYFAQNRKRVNTVDGWGTVLTPIGMFECLRIKSIVTESDSIFVDTLQLGSRFDLQTIEYKWLAPGQGLPVVQVNAQMVGGFPVVTQVIYKDTVFHSIGIAEVNHPELTIWPNPAAQWVFIHLPEQFGMLTVHDATGRVWWNREASGRTLLPVALWPEGCYLISFTHQSGRYGGKLMVSRP
ncbi:MAG: T9SS type A sorting domain-containing protein [Chitinophagales bacterium]|nr:T9SS type A sorting domain-containing protein [Chitinophagales bacterium]MDW8427727.1 T9SS type A sorting domain-containing protein [Chitinophagales bacterium]